MLLAIACSYIAILVCGIDTLPVNALNTLDVVKDQVLEPRIGTSVQKAIEVTKSIFSSNTTPGNGK